MPLNTTHLNSKIKEALKPLYKLINKLSLSPYLSFKRRERQFNRVKVKRVRREIYQLNACFLTHLTDLLYPISVSRREQSDGEPIREWWVL